MRLHSLSFLILLLLLNSCCGYQFDTVPSKGQAPTVSVPYIVGDIDGELTAAVIREVASSGTFVYVPHGGMYTLRIVVVDDYDENVGFRYDLSKKLKVKHQIIPVETREWMVLEASLETAQCQLERGPVRLKAFAEYDHDYYTIRDRVNIFSLGQLTDVDSAEDASKTHLYRRLARKVSDWLTFSQS